MSLPAPPAPSSPPHAELSARLAAAALAKASELAGAVGHILFNPGSSFSLYSLAAALLIAAGFLILQRRARGRRVRIKTILRALFPRRMLFGASGKADAGFMLLNIFALGGLIGWAMLSYDAIGHWTLHGLVGAFGRRPPSGLAPWLSGAIMTVVLFLVYEFTYWLDHYLSHAVPMLWAFHRVHHTAETLSPVTVFRVHPVDTLVFYNITAVFLGLTQGVSTYLLGAPVAGFSLSGTNLILLAFVFVTVHLQHSQVWIAFTGIWGKIFLSPAHHQIHHADNPADFGKNLGSCLAIWDWMFGTLRLPAPRREALRFGVDAEGELPHGVTDGLITPFVRAARVLKPAFPAWRRPVAGTLPSS